VYDWILYMYDIHNMTIYVYKSVSKQVTKRSLVWLVSGPMILILSQYSAIDQTPIAHLLPLEDSL